MDLGTWTIWLGGLATHLPVANWIGDALNWVGQEISQGLYGLIFGTGLGNLLYGILGGNNPLVDSNSLNIATLIQVLFMATCTLGLAIGSIALMAKMARSVWSHQGGGGNLFSVILLDVVPKFMILAFLLSPVVPNSQAAIATGAPKHLCILLGFFTWAAGAFGAFGGGIVSMIIGAWTHGAASAGVLSGAKLGVYSNACSGLTGKGPLSVCHSVTQVLGSLSTTNGGGLPSIVMVLVLIAFILYFLVLMLFRLIALVFAMATAPLVLGLGIYDWKNQFTQAWTKTFLAVLVQPILLGFGLAISLVMAAVIMGPPTASGSLNEGGAVIGAASMAVGLFFTSTIVKQFSNHFFGAHSFKEAMAFGAGAGLMAIGGGSKARGQDRLQNLSSAKDAAHEGVKNNLAEKTEARTGEGRGGKMARWASSHSAVAGAGIVGGGALWDKANAGKKQEARMGEANNLVRNQMKQEGTMPNKLVKDWAEARGKSFSSAGEAATAYADAEENKGVMRDMVGFAARNGSNDAGGNLAMNWDQKHPEAVGRFEETQGRINSNYEKTGSILPQMMGQQGTVPNQMVGEWATAQSTNFDSESAKVQAFQGAWANQPAMEYMRGYMAANMGKDGSFDWDKHPEAAAKAKTLLG